MSPQNSKEEKTADTTVLVSSPCDDQETNKENGVANVLIDDIMVLQEKISPIEIHELELNNLAAAESSPLMVPTTTPPTPILTSSEDIIMISVSAYVKELTLPSQMSRELKTCHDEYASHSVSMEDLGHQIMRASKVPKQSQQTSDVEDLAEAAMQPRLSQ
ncbi:hypothetical protein M569_10987 [Genlisea aurea]|uniref:Uncharacterized protein n=1 Tax=Genlisea aurea TaxID=192259 RepID=S8DV63_9LAMI|nr:hypothetical protein M569_10987 [Genlisea aurea]